MSDIDYRPINCDFYDHFEIHAMRNSWLKISYGDAEEPRVMYTRIKNLETRKGEEFAILLDNQELRLDRVKELIPLNKDGTLVGFLLDKLGYNHWANQQFLKVLTTITPVDNISKTFSHIINAHDIWNKRIQGDTKYFQPWQLHPVIEWPGLVDELFLSTVQILNRLDPDSVISYQTTEGIARQSTVSDIIYHIINHSTYHRGQIIVYLQELKLDTVSTDAIFYQRQI